jgi:phosphoribosylamine--glycine ligase
MGAVSPVPFADEVFLKNVEEKVIKPTIKGLKAENLEYRGFIFFGLIKVGDEPYVIEYNCRMGDPETEVVIPRLKNDFLRMLVAAAKQELNKIKIEEDDRFACTVMAVSGGYPGEYEKGYVIHGFDKVDNAESILFHAGTKQKDGKTVTMAAGFLYHIFGNSIFEAVEKSKEELQNISFTGCLTEEI